MMFLWDHLEIVDVQDAAHHQKRTTSLCAGPQHKHATPLHNAEGILTCSVSPSLSLESKHAFANLLDEKPLNKDCSAAQTLVLLEKTMSLTLCWYLKWEQGIVGNLWCTVYCVPPRVHADSNLVSHLILLLPLQSQQ